MGRTPLNSLARAAVDSPAVWRQAISVSLLWRQPRVSGQFRLDGLRLGFGALGFRCFAVAGLDRPAAQADDGAQVFVAAASGGGDRVCRRPGRRSGRCTGRRCRRSSCPPMSTSIRWCGVEFGAAAWFAVASPRGSRSSLVASGHRAGHPWRCGSGVRGDLDVVRVVVSTDEPRPPHRSSPSRARPA